MEATTVTMAILLAALGQVESENKDHAIGKSGEVSRYQIMRDIWDEETNYSKRWWDVGYSKLIAQQLLTKRIDWFVNGANRLPIPEEVYAMWNKPGLMQRNGYDWNKLPVKVQERCKRYGDAVRMRHRVVSASEKLDKPKRKRQK